VRLGKTSPALPKSCKLKAGGVAIMLLSLWPGGGQAQGLGSDIQPSLADKRSVHHDALGNPCLLVRSEVRAHVGNPDIYDQMLIIRNQCVQSIKIRACFVESDRCIDNEISGFQRQEIVLGISPMRNSFRYYLRER
jgi:hypothetical protein